MMVEVTSDLEIKIGVIESYMHVYVQVRVEVGRRMMRGPWLLTLGSDKI